MNPLLPEKCQHVQEAIQADPLNLTPEQEAHVAQCRMCQEIRVQWMALQDVENVLAPSGYFATLPDRVIRKLPGRPTPRLRSQPFLWAAAALVAVAAGLSGYWAGRNTTQSPAPAVALSEDSELLELPLAAPFQDENNVFSQVSTLSPQDAQWVAQKLAEQHAQSSSSPRSQP